MKKTIAVIVSCLALATLGLHAQSTNLVLAPAPPPHASALITEGQFATLLNAAPSNAVSGASTTVQSISLFGGHLSINGVPSAGITDIKQVTLSSAQLTAFLAGLPALPVGETAANIRNVNANRTPTGIVLFVQFSS